MLGHLSNFLLFRIAMVMVQVVEVLTLEHLLFVCPLIPVVGFLSQDVKVLLNIDDLLVPLLKCLADMFILLLIRFVTVLHNVCILETQCLLAGQPTVVSLLEPFEDIRLNACVVRLLFGLEMHHVVDVLPQVVVGLNVSLHATL